MDYQKRVKLLLKDFLKLGDESDLLIFLNKHPEIISNNKLEEYEYPDVHRIVDIQIGENKYRICRQISKNEDLIFIEIDDLRHEVGVPLWLEGEKLKEWEESDSGLKEEIDWEKYR